MDNMSNRFERKLKRQYRRQERRRLRKQTNQKLYQQQNRQNQYRRQTYSSSNNNNNNNNNTDNNLLKSYEDYNLIDRNYDANVQGRAEQAQQLELLQEKQDNPELDKQIEQEQEEQQEQEQNHWDKPLTVKETLFSPENQTLVVKGQIISHGKVHSMQTLGADNQVVEIRAVRAELMDVDEYNDVDGLSIILSKQLAENVKAGENCKVLGTLQIEQKNKTVGFPVLFAHDLRYTKQQENREQDDDSLSQHQIDRVHNFCKYATQEYNDDNNIIDRLVSIYSGKEIIGNEHIKEGLLYSLVSITANTKDGSDINSKRKRINLGLLGFPGGGKTFTASSVLKYVANGKVESAQNSSGKSLVAMISREGEGGRTLRIGPVARHRQSLCVIDEIGDLPLLEQSLLQNVMEEGTTTINKYGFNANIRCDTVIIWTANPKNATNISTRLSFKDIAIRKQIIDRTDLLIVQTPVVGEARKEFNRLMLEHQNASKERKKILSYYNDYIRLHLAVVKRKYSSMNEDIKITPEARELLSNADVEIQKKKAEGAGSIRTLNTLSRLTEVIAKLKLKDKADVNDARRAISYYNKVSTVNMIDSDTEDEELTTDPAVQAVNTIIESMQDNTSYTTEELAQIATKDNEAVSQYLQDITNVRDNRRLRRVIDILLQDGRVIKTNNKPAKFMLRA